MTTEHSIEFVDWDTSDKAIVHGFACPSCGYEGAGLRSRCPRCSEGPVRSRILSSRGTVVCKTTVHRTHNWWPGATPYDLAEVRLDDSEVYIVAAVIDGEPIEVGQSVEMTKVLYSVNGAGLTVFHWSPVSGAVSTKTEEQ